MKNKFVIGKFSAVRGSTLRGTAMLLAALSVAWAQPAPVTTPPKTDTTAPATKTDSVPSTADLQAASSKKGFVIPKDRRDLVISHWTKTFRNATPPGYVSSPTAAVIAGTDMSDLAATLNSVFEDVFVKAAGDSFVIIGPRERVRQVKVMLARWLDVPLPSVNLNVLSFQASTRNYDANKIADAVELAQAGIQVTREFLRLYTIDFARYVSDLKHRSLRIPGDVPEQKVRELFAKFHLLDHNEFDAESYTGLRTDTGRIEPFVDDLAFLTLRRRDEFGPGGADIENAMQRGKALQLLNTIENQLMDKYRLLQDKSAGRVAPARASFDGQAKEDQILKDDATSARIDSDEGAKGAEVAIRLIALCRDLRAAAYPSFPFFRNVLAQSDDPADLNSLLSFLYEYSLPTSYSEVQPSRTLRGAGKNSSTGRSNSRYVLEQELQALNNQKDDIIQRRQDLETIRGYAPSDARWLSLRASQQRRLSYPAPSQTPAASAKPTAQASLTDAELQQKISDAYTKYVADLQADRTLHAKLKSKKSKNSKERQLLAAYDKRTDADLTTLNALLAQKAKPADPAKPTDPLAAEETEKDKAVTEVTDSQNAREDLDRQMMVVQRDINSVAAQIQHLDNSRLDEGRSQDGRYPSRPYAYNSYSAGLAEPTRALNPEALVNESANVDVLIKNATETFSTDIQQGILSPLIQWIQANNRGHKDGLLMSGNMALSVTSSMGASSGGTASFYAPFTPQQHLSGSDLTSLFGAATGLSVFSTQGAEAILKTFANIGAPSTAYTNIAPGTDLSVIPTVLPGGRSARLQINVKFSAQVVQDAKTSQFLPSVNSHEVRTDVPVDAFDLFPLSSFNVETTTLGDPQWRIYGLEGIPLLGNIFIGPRRPATSIGRSLIIVYTTVLPRSLDLARRYSSDQD